LAKVIAARERIGRETVRPWIVQAGIDSGGRPGVTCVESVEIKALKARVRRLEEDNAILNAATVVFAGELDPRNR
jgi:transposase-like protein